MLGELPEGLLTARQPPDVVRWAAALDRSLPAAALDRVPVVMGVAKGLIDADRVLDALNLPTWSALWEPDFDDLPSTPATPIAGQIGALWRILAVLAALPFGYEVERAGWLLRLERHVADHPDSWLQSLAWILTVGPTLHDLDATMTLKLIDSHPESVSRLREIAGSRPGRVGIRAQGIEALATGADPAGVQEWLLDAAARLLDRQREQFPRPLDAPSATWLSDLNVESLLRGASRHAVEAFADVVRADGAGEEDGLTRELLVLLAAHLGAVNPALRLSTPSGAVPKVEVTRRVIPKNEEKRIGADLGVAVTVRLPGHADIRFGDLVQVKKSKLLRDPRQVPTTRADSWTIDIAQLSDLLTFSATSAYWLIADGGGVLVVPAKMILALTGGRGRPGAGTFTVRYSDIRHVAVSLGNYLCDVLMGMWVGSTHPETVAIAGGADNRTQPRNILSIFIRIEDN